MDQTKVNFMIRLSKMQSPKGTKIKKCPHGHGLFAIKNFRKGRLIGNIIGGKVVNIASEASKFALKVPERKMWWDEIDSAKPEWDSFIDHSELENAKILFENFNSKKPQAKLVATKNIKRNKEITINYHNYGDRLYKSRRYKRTRSPLDN